MTDDPFARSLIRKSERAIQIARLCVENGDPDSAVNRAYYAMFNISRAAVLKAGVPDGELPRTHRGISEAFRQHAVLTGKIDAGLARILSRAESLRLMADYTAKEIDARAAADLVGQAEDYVRTVVSVFDLQPSAAREADQSEETRGDYVSNEQHSSIDAYDVGDEIEETQRLGRESWLTMRKQQLESGAPTIEETQAKARKDWLELRQQQRSRGPIGPADTERSRDLDRHEGKKDPSKGIGDDFD